MKSLVTITAILLTRIPMLAGAEDVSVMRFTNNDRIAGNLQSLSADSLTWSSKALRQPATFSLDKLVDVTLPARTQPENTGHIAVLTLENGDVVRGKLTAISEHAITLETSFAGTMEFNRLMISGIRIESSSDSLFRGPTSLDGWIQSPNADSWSFRNSSFISKSRGGIARDHILPEECSVKFDIQWKGDSLNLRVILFSNNPSEINPKSGYEISFQRSSVYLRDALNHNFIGSAHAQALAESDHARIEIRTQHSTGKIGLWINDRLLEAWLDANAKDNKPGSGLHFISNGSNPMRISNLLVTSWDSDADPLPAGRFNNMQNPFPNQNPLDSDSTDEATAAENAKPRMKLSNGDSIDGEVAGIDQGNIRIDTPLGPITLPIERLRSLNLKNLGKERAIRRANDIRAFFADGSVLVFRMDSVDETTIAGSSQNFGAAKFQLPTIGRIEFNIYNQSHQELHASDEW